MEGAKSLHHGEPVAGLKVDPSRGVSVTSRGPGLLPGELLKPDSQPRLG